MGNTKGNKVKWFKGMACIWKKHSIQSSSTLYLAFPTDKILLPTSPRIFFFCLPSKKIWQGSIKLKGIFVYSTQKKNNMFLCYFLGNSFNHIFISHGGGQLPPPLLPLQMPLPLHFLPLQDFLLKFRRIARKAL